MIREVVGWAEVGYDGGKVDFWKAEFGHVLVPFCADGFPAGSIGFFVLGNVFGKGVKREVGGGKGEVGEEGRALVLAFVFCEESDGAVGEFGGGVEGGAFFDRREQCVVEVVGLGVEESALILEVVRSVEARGDRHAVDVPFSDVVATVAGGFKKGGSEGCP